MYKKSFLQPILLGLITILLASCDKDFNELGTNIIDDDHFGFENYNDVTLKAYNQKTDAVASNNLPINPLGFYNNPAFGKTEANFVTQVEMATIKPTFNNTDATLYQTPAAIDSVVMEIPYFSHVPKDATITDNVKPYVLDSIYGPNTATGVTITPFKLSVFQSNYYLRDLDPNLALGEQQAFYSDEKSTIDNSKIPVLLNNSDNTAENSAFYFDKREHRLKTLDDNGDPVYTRSAPSMRLHLNKTVFTSLILNAPDGKLDTNANFRNYFRGLYFKVENETPGSGNMALMNFKGGKITVYYNEDKKKTTGTVVTWERVNKTFALNLSGNSISLLQNSQPDPDYLAAVNSPNEASRLYVKGGEGSVAMIDLFDQTDTYKYVVKKIAGKPVDEKGNAIETDAKGDPKPGFYFTYEKVNSPNGVSDELDDLRYPVYTNYQNVDYYSTKNRWMINEANLVFNIDRTATGNAASQLSTFEPNRIFLYDMTNKKVLFDYTYDYTTNILFPKFNHGVFGGILLNENNKIFKQKNTDNAIVNKGTKYKIRITNHIRNLIKNDSTNVRLGLSVTENIANVGFSKLRTPNTHFNKIPTMSVMNPLGAILYGTGSAPADKRLKLEIYYTKPD